jgi:preprotein translocase SecE subunit
MAKTRAQRKAERRAREARERRQGGRPAQDEAVAQRRTQVPESGEVAEVEAALEAGEVEAAELEAPEVEEIEAPEIEDIEAPEVEAPEVEDVEAPEVEAPEVEPEVEAPEEELTTGDGAVPEAPAPARVSRAERRAQRKRQKEEERRREEERRERQRAREQKLRQTAAEERKRGPVIGFLASCVAELRRVQWPDRDTLIQASAVTIVFVAIAAAYLGALDALFNFLVKQIL